MKKNRLLRLLSLLGLLCTYLSAYAANPPVLMSPADRATVNLANPLVIMAKANDASARKLSVKVLLNDPRQQVYETSKAVAADQTQTPQNFAVSTSVLLPEKQYLIELKTTNASGQMVGQRYFTFFTGSAVAPEPKPYLVTPSPGAKLVFCDLVAFVGITVNANNPRARKIFVKGIGSIDSSPDNAIELMPQQATSTVGAAFRIGYPPNSYAAFQPGEVRMKELKLTTVDSLGNILAESTYMVPTTGPDRKAPDFISPATNAVGVSTRPTIVMGNYPDNSCEKWIFISYELDRYPADWMGSDYLTEQVASTASTWQPQTELAPNTRYEIRVNGGFTGVGAGPIAVTSTFTTGSSPARLAGAEMLAQSAVFPNPFANEFSIQLHNNYQKATITVISQQGQLLLSKESQGGELVPFKGDGLHSGLYLVRISDGSGLKEQFKVVKQ